MNAALQTVQTLLSTTGLHLSVGKRVLVTELEWQVNTGECWCIIGRNGAGKSTLLRTLAGMRAIEQGNVAIKNKKSSNGPSQT